jgi:hypothetical protein
MSKRSLPLVAAGILALSLLTPAGASAQINQIKDALQDIDAKLDAVVVPFKVVDLTGGICDSAGPGTSVPEIHIDSDGATGSFVVVSILLRTAAPGVPETGFRAFSVNNVIIDGELFDTRTGNLLGPTDGSGVLESVDLMATPVRRSADLDDPLPGGGFPHQIVADSDGSDDIRIRLFCSSDDDDLNIDGLLVSGWKRPADTITVTYEPGS